MKWCSDAAFPVSRQLDVGLKTLFSTSFCSVRFQVCQEGSFPWPDEGFLLEIHSHPLVASVFSNCSQTAPCPCPDVRGGLRPRWRRSAPAGGQRLCVIRPLSRLIPCWAVNELGQLRPKCRPFMFYPFFLSWHRFGFIRSKKKHTKASSYKLTAKVKRVFQNPAWSVHVSPVQPIFFSPFCPSSSTFSNVLVFITRNTNWCINQTRMSISLFSCSWKPVSSLP